MATRHQIIVICVALVALVCGEPRIVSAGDAAGSLLIESDPAGASVYVDGRLAGETPLTLPEVIAGVHRVRVVRLGYLENSRLVTVTSGTRATLRARLTDPAPQTAAAAAALKIVVVEGEGAVSIIQQKTAVAPVIEVRDRNDQPVSGALVRFAIGKGRASFNGARTLSVTTDAAGRATATGLAATSRGALQITASATFQGQTAAAAIAQTTVATAAEASSVAAGTSTASASGGGLSHTAIAGIVGGAGIAGAMIASNKLRTTSQTFTGPFSGQIIVTTTTSGSGSPPCASTQAITGTLTIQFEERADGTLTGTGSTTGTRIVTALTPPSCGSSFSITFNFGGPITGTTGNITYASQSVATNATDSQAFTGALSNGVITGALNFSEVWNGQLFSGGGSTTFAVTLR